MTNPTPHSTPVPRPAGPDERAVIVTCTTTYPIRDGASQGFVFQLRSDPPYRMLIEVSSADPDRYRPGERYTVTLTPSPTTGPAPAPGSGLRTRQPFSGVQTLRDRLAGQVGDGVPTALLRALLDIVAQCDEHRSTGSRSVPVLEIDGAIAWRLRDYLTDRVAPRTPTPPPSGADTAS